METVEPQRPDGGSLLRPTSTDVAEPILQHAGSAQILDCYRNGHGRASGARFGSACPNRRRLPWALWQCRHRRVQEGNTTCGLRPDSGLLFSDLPQQTLPSLFYNMRTPPRYWIATATDMVEPRGPESGQHVELEGDFRRRSGSVDIDESRKETPHAGSAQILDCYRNGHRQASEARFLREQIPTTYCRKKEKKGSNGRSSDNNRNTNSRRGSKRNVGSTEVQTMEDTKVNT